MIKLYQSSWSDVTLEEYIELIEIEENNKGLLSKSLETLIYLTDDESIENLPSSVIIKTYMDNKWLSIAPLNNIVEEIDDYRLKPLSKLSLSEWIDLDSAIISNNLTNILAIVYKKYELDQWGNIIYEPYIYSPSGRHDIFSNCSIVDVIGIINETFQYRTMLLDSFSGLFESYEEELSEDEKGTLSPQEIRDIDNDIKKDNNKRGYAWQILLDDMSNGDWSSIPGILDLPHVFVFNMRMAKKVYES